MLHAHGPLGNGRPPPGRVDPLRARRLADTPLRIERTVVDKMRAPQMVDHVVVGAAAAVQGLDAGQCTAAAGAAGAGGAGGAGGATGLDGVADVAADVGHAVGEVAGAVAARPGVCGVESKVVAPPAEAVGWEVVLEVVGGDVLDELG